MDTGGTSTNTGDGVHIPDQVPTPSTDASPKGLPVESQGAQAQGPTNSGCDSTGGPVEPLVVVEEPLEFEADQLAVLETLETGLTRSGACKAANVGRSTFYKRLSENTPRGAAFRAAVLDAEKVGVHCMIDRGLKRAMDGWQEPVFHRGIVVGHIEKFDSDLLKFLIMQRDKSFRQRHEITGADGSPLNPSKVEHVVKYDFSDLDPDKKNELYQLLKRSRVLSSAGN